MQYLPDMATYLDIAQNTFMLQYLQNVQKKPLNFAANPEAKGAFEDILSRSLTNGVMSTMGTQPQQAATGIDLADYTDEEIKFRKCFRFVIEKEGSRLVKEDAGKGASRYGILQSTARAFGYKGNIRNITKEQVEGIYRKLWERSGAASLPYPLCVVHFDTYVNSPAAAGKILEKSQGDIDTYLKIREQRYVRLATAKPQVYAKYLNGWKNRVNSLRTMVAQHMKEEMFAGNDPSSVKKG